MSKNRVVTVLLLLIVTLALAACGRSESSASAAELPATVVPATEIPADLVVLAATEAPIEVVAEAPAEPVAEATVEPVGESTTASQTTLRTFVVTPGNGSTAQYAVEEEFFGQAIPFVTAVGTTNQVDGSLTLAESSDGVALQDGGFTVNIQSLTSDQSRRDNAIRRDWLQSNTYPNAVFSNIELVNLPAGVAEGQEVSFQMTGNLTVREIAQPVTWDVTAKVENGVLTGTATTFILMADYGFQAPNIGGMLKVTDGVTVTVNLVATEV